MANGSQASRSAWLERALLAIALSVPALARAEAPPAVASADPVLAAEHQAAQAFEAYGQKRYADAIALYERAYASAPSADALYNIARIYDIGLGERARAIAAYERCISEPGASLERLERTSERLLVLRRSERAELEAERTPVPAGSTATPVPAPSEPGTPSSTMRTAARISGAAGVVGIGVGLGFGVAALSNADAADAACNGNRCSSERGVAAAKSAATQATLATTGISVGAALLVTGAVLWLLDRRGDSEDKMPSRVRFTPVASASELALTLGGSW
ncbi:MAG: tetratricopeptide repeat protein [Deltaproteobacteria bacterium]